METKWILKLIDQITAPLRSIEQTSEVAAKAVNQVAQKANEVNKAVEKVSKPMKEAEQATSGLKGEMQGTADAATRLQRNIDTIKKDIERYKGKLSIETDPEKIRVYGTMLDELNKKLKKIDKEPDAKAAQTNWGLVAFAANQTWRLMEKVVQSLDFAGDIANLENNIKRMTGATGDELDDLTSKVYNIGKVFDQNSLQIALSANAMTKQWGGSFEGNLNLIQQGFEKGADLNGDFLQQLREYGPQLKAAGITGAEGIAIMVNAAKDGVFSDKAIDGIKEANLALREMGQPQINALHAVGLTVKELAGKTTFEAMGMIAKAMKTAPIQAREMVMKDIFKGAGEDSGMAFIEGLSSINMDINQVPSVQQAGASTKSFLADMQSWFATSFKGIAANISIIGSIGAALAGFFPIIQAITMNVKLMALANRLAAGAQWLLNAAFAASPIGWIVVGIAAITAGILLAWKHFEGFRKVVMGLWESFKQVFTNIAGLFKAVLGPIAETIAAIKEGRWADAAKAAIQINPISMGVNAVKYIADGGLTKGVADAWKLGEKEGEASFKADKQKDKKDATGTGTSYTDELGKKGDKVTLDGKLFNPKTGKMDGLEINGSGSNRGITMNLTINNHFEKISSKMDIRKVADDVAGMINDRLRQALVTTN